MNYRNGWIAVLDHKRAILRRFDLKQLTAFNFMQPTDNAGTAYLEIEFLSGYSILLYGKEAQEVEAELVKFIGG